MKNSIFRKFIAIFGCLSVICCALKVSAAELPQINISVKGDYETSTVFDMGMYPAVQLSAGSSSYGNPYNQCSSLNVPTQITKQGGYYFIVDCYNNQVLYSDSIGKPLRSWRVMTKNVNQPHGIASDGQAYLVADTENNRVLVFEQKGGTLCNTQRLDGIGKRPHYIKYDEETDSFFVWSSMTGDMYILKKDSATGIVCIQEMRHIKELANYYVRSFTIAGDLVLFPSGTNSYVTVADKDTMQVLYRYPVPFDISGMAYIMSIGNYFYMTVSTDYWANQDVAKIIRTKDLSTLSNGVYETVNSGFPSNGIPYYIDIINGAYYMTYSGSSKLIWRFNVEGDLIKNVAAVY